jgi:hypothetical protein
LSKFYVKNLKHCQETPIGACKWRSQDLKSERLLRKIEKYVSKANNGEVNRPKIEEK